MLPSVVMTFSDNSHESLRKELSTGQTISKLRANGNQEHDDYNCYDQ